ncbi:MAG: RNA polymerase sigma factor [Planctomycetes bacterium]|nr:RNA polymerase sigma factor [Planctomycetota bacterium]
MPTPPDFQGEPVKKEDLAGYGPESMAYDATQLMLAAKGGDPAAFDQLVERLRGRAFRVAHSLVGSRDDAMELSQEAFLKVYRSRDSFREGEPFLPWFHRILRNTCFSFLRSKGRLGARSVSDRAAGADPDDADYDIADDGASPGDHILADERAAAFHAALQTLSARDREILALRHFQECSYKEIARSLGHPRRHGRRACSTRCRRLRDALGKSFLDEVGVGDGDGGDG